MQLGLPLEPAEPEPRELTEPPEHPEPRYFVRHRRARRYLLRVDADGRVRVTIPRGGSRRDADAFAATHLDWIRRQQSRSIAPTLSEQERRTGLQRARLALAGRLLGLGAGAGRGLTTG